MHTAKVIIKAGEGRGGVVHVRFHEGFVEEVATRVETHMAVAAVGTPVIAHFEDTGHGGEVIAHGIAGEIGCVIA